eukprot:scaffold10235_cov131-Skeletonema_marinoi.AAC.16
MFQCNCMQAKHTFLLGPGREAAANTGVIPLKALLTFSRVSLASDEVHLLVRITFSESDTEEV